MDFVFWCFGTHVFKDIVGQLWSVYSWLCIGTHVFAEIVDQVLSEDDLDSDGYLTYLEYVLARRREEARNERMQRDKA